MFSGGKLKFPTVRSPFPPPISSATCFTMLDGVFVIEELNGVCVLPVEAFCEIPESEKDEQVLNSEDAVEIDILYRGKVAVLENLWLK